MRCAPLGNSRGLKMNWSSSDSWDPAVRCIFTGNLTRVKEDFPLVRFLLLSHSVRGDIANSGNVKKVEHSSDSVYPREILCTLVRFCVPSSVSLFQAETWKIIKAGFPAITYVLHFPQVFFLCSWYVLSPVIKVCFSCVHALTSPSLVFLIIEHVRYLK